MTDLQAAIALVRELLALPEFHSATLWPSSMKPDTRNNALRTVIAAAEGSQALEARCEAAETLVGLADYIDGIGLIARAKSDPDLKLTSWRLLAEALEAGVEVETRFCDYEEKAAAERERDDLANELRMCTCERTGRAAPGGPEARP